MSLDAHVVVRRADFVLDLALAVEPGETVALVGSNGAGKTTFLHAVAGLVRLDDGHVRLGGRVLSDVRAGTHVPPERRRCGLVFQQHLVFPHLSALENVAFGLRAAGVRRREARRRAAGWLDRLGVADCGRRCGAQLSGGQAQRVALARSLACAPDVVLLDEPFAALDLASRPAVRDLLRSEVLDGTRPTVLVTHDPQDARELADRVVSLSFGSPCRGTSAAGADAAP
ncbi:ATP-binding cassette domain-containing protein [Actinotalea sp. M2MS4P-6]|uniref:sulfate/molybdate ABC transporter ATP-binding protein n=1 Tax=Actinotalea sp. M2MS4P-6 TaxID=2983762 RepID=UPI0021E3E4B7|nr:ATP-binding cassette domain-containing protein [Actinotalea sp. M2MS4P-6]MCV2393855.1 ATP-binding cassette domain-containing protein [Actinotalea sp. M2MS4P-6]